MRGDGSAPWLIPVDHAEVRLRCRWPAACPERILRGAVVGQVERQIGASVEWHNHGDDGESSARPALTLYRVRSCPEVYFYGRTAHQRAAWLIRSVGALMLPGGEVIEVESGDLRTGATGCQVLGKSWATYDLVTPIFPSLVTYRRRPREPGAERRAWAVHFIESTVLDWLNGARLEYGLDREQGQTGISVYIHDFDDIDGSVKLMWERPGRSEYVAHGFRCRFTTNAVLPDGIGLGRHRAEGFGEIRLVSREGRA